ncbi:MAG: hypothetical protein GF365_01255|nr:hypothetical protein [Candidatus Buchananbacteria bacterium]
MPEEKERIKNFFEQKSEKITNKIEKTPMEKFFVFFLVLITISAAVLGYLQFKKNIEEPLYSSYLREKRGELRQQYQVANTNEATTEEETAKLQKQDSDLDGLSDYSEIYLYKTSAYLEDTDGDGLLDKEEIVQGTDPACPEGEECYGPQITDEAPTDMENEQFYEQEQENFANTNQMDELGSSDSAVLDSDLLELQTQLLSGEITLEELGLNDPQLQEMLDQARELQAQEAEQLSSEEKEPIKEELKELSPDEIRQELEQRGIDKSLLEQIDDETLKQLFLETLNAT